MEAANSKNLNVRAGKNPKIIVITDAISEKVWNGNRVMSVPAADLFIRQAKKCGFTPDDFVFINPAPPIPDDVADSDARVNKFIAEYREEFIEVLNEYLPDARVVVPQGKLAIKQLAAGKATITKARGTLQNYPATGSLPVLPTFSPQNVLARPDVRQIYESDFHQLRTLRDCNWNMDTFLQSGSSEGYRWCLDLEDVIRQNPKTLAVDCETVGLRSKEEGFRLLCVSITTKAGRSYVVPLDIDYWNDATLFDNESADLPRLNRRRREKLIDQLKTLLGNPDVAVTGHNLKFDVHALKSVGVEIANWYCDTMQLAFVCDDNMQSKSLDDCTRRWLPDLAGYADEFNSKTDKSRMHCVEHADMLKYAGGDTDATYRLTRVLLKEAKEDMRNWETFIKVQMPTLRAFVDMEQHGIRIDESALEDLRRDMDAREQELYHRIIEAVPARVLREHEGAWSFSRPDFIRDILFGPHGVKDENGKSLKPTEFTKTTKRLPKDQRKASTSKDHLMYFQHLDIVRDIMEYQTIKKMQGTYVGRDGGTEITKMEPLKTGGYNKKVTEAFAAIGVELEKSKAVRKRRRVIDPELAHRDIPFGKQHLRVDEMGNVYRVHHRQPTGFWQYLQNRESGMPRIHPSFFLHRTVTGRTASSDPNAQNIPKRGALAKSFRKIFVPSPGYRFIEVDLSQAEIRVAAWMANETTMIDIYKKDGDIHSATAAAVMGITLKKFLAGRKDKTPLMEVANDWPGSGQWLRAMGNNERMKVTVADFCDYKRYQAKAVNFGFLYGMGWLGFKRYAKVDYGIDYTDKEAIEIREAFFRKYPKLASWHRGMQEFVQRNGYVRALHGAIRRLPNVDSIDENIAGGSVRQAINSPVQRFASDLGIIALSRLIRDADPEIIRPVMFIHDAVIVEAKIGHEEEAASALKFYMETPPLEKWFGIRPPLPIKADASIGDNLSEMEERGDIESIEPSWYKRGEEAPTTDRNAQKAWAKKRRRGIVLTD